LNVRAAGRAGRAEGQLPRAGLSRPFAACRFAYGTITLMRVLIVSGRWQQLRFRDVVVVIAGPALAMFLSHLLA